MRFWTALQYPLAQAVLVDNEKIINSIPDRPAKTPERHVAAVGEFDGNLVVARRACLELWDKRGTEQIAHLYHPWFYSVHRVLQYKNSMIVLSSGIDLIFIIDWDGQVSWEWWGWKNGLCTRPAFIESSNWQVEQFTSKLLKVNDGLHLNSIYLRGDIIYTSSLSHKQILEINIITKRYLVKEITTEGCHGPIPVDPGFIYGDTYGIMRGDERVVEGFEWVKYIGKIKDGYIFTHEQGITTTDNEWNILKTISIPRPFGVALLME